MFRDLFLQDIECVAYGKPHPIDDFFRRVWIFSELTHFIV